MTLSDIVRKVVEKGLNEYVQAQRSNSSCYTGRSNTSDQTKYGGKTVDEWNMEWQCIGALKSANLTPYNHSVGLYRHVVHGKTRYVGRAVEWNNGGFRKRLSDYRRDSDSARKHLSGRIINDHIDEITTYILVTGSDQKASQVACQLEGRFIAKYNPDWNRQIHI